jgi:hypothetical protein
MELINHTKEKIKFMMGKMKFMIGNYQTKGSCGLGSGWAD